MMTLIPVCGFAPFVCGADMLGSIRSSILARSGMYSFLTHSIPAQSRIEEETTDYTKGGTLEK